MAKSDFYIIEKKHSNIYSENSVSGPPLLGTIPKPSSRKGPAAYRHGGNLNLTERYFEIRIDYLQVQIFPCYFILQLTVKVVDSSPRPFKPQ